MKTLFIHAIAEDDVNLTKEALEKLPKTVGIITNIQHLSKVQEIKKQLPNAVICGQVLGCRADNAIRCAKKVDAFLFVGGGEFHPLFAAAKTGKDVYCWNPADKLLTKISKQEVEAYNKNKMRQLKLFYNSKKVGILVSTKVGQSSNKINTFSAALKMQQPIAFSKRKDREYFLFTFDTLNTNEFENFQFIDCWINTACSRIADDSSKIVNVDDILEFEAENK